MEGETEDIDSQVGEKTRLEDKGSRRGSGLNVSEEP